MNQLVWEVFQLFDRSHSIAWGLKKNWNNSQRDEIVAYRILPYITSSSLPSDESKSLSESPDRCGLALLSFAGLERLASDFNSWNKQQLPMSPTLEEMANNSDICEIIIHLL